MNDVLRTILELLFWLATFWILLPLVLYPVGVSLLAKFRPSRVKRSEGYLPHVTFIMAAYNEEGVIERRMQNYLDLNYPRELLEFRIGSDGSTDRTDDIIREYQKRDETISLTRFDRRGKTHIVYSLAEGVTSEVILFCDADVVMHPDSLRHIAANFADPEVGGVVSHIVYEDSHFNAGSVGERTYHGMEDQIREHESIVYSTISPTGQCFAVRNGAYTPLSDYRMSDDMNLAITIALNGYRVWFEPDAIVMEISERDLGSEYRRRVRIGQQSMATFLQYEGTRWPWRSWTGFQIWSRKVARNLVTIPALIILVTSLLLYQSGLPYLITAIFCLVWFAMMVVGFVVDRLRLNVPVIGYPLYFTTMLLALTTGSLRYFLRGGGLAMWNTPRLQKKPN